MRWCIIRILKLFPLQALKKPEAMSQANVDKSRTKTRVQTILLSVMEELSIVNGLYESNKVGQIIKQQGIDKIKYYIDVAKSEGATLLDGVIELTKGAYENGYYFAPTLFSDVTNE